MRVTVAHGDPDNVAGQGYCVWYEGRFMERVYEAGEFIGGVGYLIRSSLDRSDYMGYTLTDHPHFAYAEILYGRVTIVDPRKLPVPVIP